jgi:hypothetical protein
MKLKKEYLILVAVIIGLILYLALRDTDRARYELPKLSEIPEKLVSRLEIGKAGQSIVLKKEGDKWYIEPKAYPADSSKVQKMMKTIDKLTLTALISESKNYIRYDLNEDKKIAVKAWMGNTLGRDFDIGKPAATCQHTFIKLAGDPNVYHARGDFRREFDQTVNQLRDMTVLTFDPADIQEIVLLRGKDSVIVSQKEIPAAGVEQKNAAGSSPQVSGMDKVWVTGGGKQVEASELKRLLAALSGMKCEEYIADRKKDDFKDPVYNFVLKGSTEHSLSIFDRNGKDELLYPAISSENDYPFLMSEYQVNNLKKSLEELTGKKEK